MQRLFPKILAALLVAACLTGLPAEAHPGIDEQIADLTQRIEANPNDATLYLRRGELYRIHREWARAEADYGQAMKLDPELTIVHQARGRMMLESDRAEKAIAPLEIYLAKHSKDTKTLALLSRAYAQLGRHMEAANGYARALASVEDGTPRPEYYLERARALVAAGKDHTKTAIDCLDDGLKTLNYPVTLQLYAMELEIGLRNYDAALARLDQIASRSARKESWLVQRGEILERAGRLDQAREAYRRTLDAIDALPATRARNRAVERLKEQATAAIERLDTKNGEPEPDASP